ncbi:RHTO0S11e03268g1_1 [Rhodotorula toruloides]|uniref:RHTO0S11e03268g1_1 n=2 Tax=Rhodotorula toruloides TaxID=5286 RepID=A0A061BCT6_RHOTO|nr:uncharacterized protein RHTO_01720 [Rhodotorula toruloides NP11]EMS21660.1 hypothetical protein RHTO_01720 [Rhodotorula toruloides NP11]CDR45680.1 RHTO0S11e03268g1_1 [Rhodotorula toruloides]
MESRRRGREAVVTLVLAPASSCSAACAPPPTRPQNHADVYSTHAARSPARELSCPGARVQTRDELEPTNRTAGSPVVSKPLPSSRFSVCSKLTGFQTVEFEGGGGPRHRSLVPLARGYDSRRTSGPFVVCVGMKGGRRERGDRAEERRGPSQNVPPRPPPLPPLQDRTAWPAPHLIKPQAKPRVHSPPSCSLFPPKKLPLVERTRPRLPLVRRARSFRSLMPSNPGDRACVVLVGEDAGWVHTVSRCVRVSEAVRKKLSVVVGPSKQARRIVRPSVRRAEPGTCPLRALEWPPAIAPPTPASARKPRHSARCPPCTHTPARSAANDTLARRAASCATLENGLLANPSLTPRPSPINPARSTASAPDPALSQPQPSQPFVLVRASQRADPTLPLSLLPPLRLAIVASSLVPSLARQRRHSC